MLRAVIPCKILKTALTYFQRRRRVCLSSRVSSKQKVKGYQCGATVSDILNNIGYILMSESDFCC